MSSNIYKITNDCFEPVVVSNEVNSKDILLHEINCENRIEALEYLKTFLPKHSVLEYVLNPSEHIRFEIIDDIAYGELAYFDLSTVERINYIGIISSGNNIFIIKDKGIKLIAGVQDSFLKVVDFNKIKVEAKFIIYLLIVEIITNLSKKILVYREKVEEFAKEFKDMEDMDPDDFLEAKSKLSDFGRVIEKLFFTMYFPPVRTILDHDSPYRKYFEELLKSIEMLKESLKHTENRLDRLHEHYQLILQDKSNKRINLLTIIQSIFAPLTLIVGVYGMNFTNMPELNFKYGYFIALGVMGIVASLFLRYFYKNDWFS